MDDMYRCIGKVSIDDIHIKNIMILKRKSNVPVTPSTRLLKDHILTKMNSIDGGIADKTENHIERRHQVAKCLEQRYKCVTDFTQSQTSQINLQDLLSNPIIEIKSE